MPYYGLIQNNLIAFLDGGESDRNVKLQELQTHEHSSRLRTRIPACVCLHYIFSREKEASAASQWQMPPREKLCEKKTCNALEDNVQFAPGRRRRLREKLWPLRQPLELLTYSWQSGQEMRFGNEIAFWSIWETTACVTRSSTSADIGDAVRIALALQLHSSFRKLVSIPTSARL